MKKYGKIILGLFSMLLAFTACNSPMDENPVYQTPTTFVLNEPALADQYIELTPTGTVNLTCSQPDYGYAAVASYYVQVSLTEDFAKFVEVNADPLTSCDLHVSSAEVAQGICKLRGVTSEDNYTDEPARVVYFRLRACIPAVQGSDILSNVVKLNNVKGYFALKVPGYIYMVGKPEGWAGPTAANKEHYADWRLFESEDAIGSKIYTGTFEVPAEQFILRFYTALTGWDADSYGTQADDSSVNIALDDTGVYIGGIVKGKGAFQIPDWKGGKVKMTVDMSNPAKMKVTFKKL